MRVTSSVRYDASPDAVYAMLTDRAFQDRKLKGTGALRWEVEVTARPDGGATVRTSRDLPTDDVPDAFRSLIGPSLTLVQTETWGPQDGDGGRVGTVVVEVPGAPVKLTGTLRLAPAGAGTEETVDGDLKARVPLIGGRIERAAEPALRAAIDAEERIGREWLAGR